MKTHQDHGPLLFLKCLVADVESGTCAYGSVDADTYKLNANAWAVFSRKQKDLTLLRAVAVAHSLKNGLLRGPGPWWQLLQHLEPLEAHLCQGVNESTTLQTSLALPVFLGDLAGLSDVTYNTLDALCVDLADLWLTTPAFQKALNTDLLDVLFSYRACLTNNKETHLSLLCMANAATEAPELKAVAPTSQALYQPSFEVDVLEMLSGTRTGAYLSGSYVLVNCDEIAKDVSTKKYANCYAAPGMMALVTTDPGKWHAGLSAVVKSKLLEVFKPAKASTLEKLATAVNTSGNLFACRKAQLADLVSKAGLPDVDRRAHTTTTGSKRGRKGPSIPRKVCGIDTYFRKGLFVDPRSFGTTTMLEHAHEDYMTTVVGGQTMCSVVTMNIWLSTLKPDDAAPYLEAAKALTALAIRCHGDVATYRATFAQQTAEAKRAAGQRTRLVLEFTAEQDQLIQRDWRPYMAPTAGERLQAAMPEHTWLRIFARGNILKAVTAAGGAAVPQDDVLLRGLIGDDVVKKYRRGLGGKPRITVPSSPLYPTT